MSTNSKIGLIGAVLALCGITRNTPPTDTTHYTYATPEGHTGSALGGVYARRNQRQLRKAARQQQTTVRKLKGVGR